MVMRKDPPPNVAREVPVVVAHATALRGDGAADSRAAGLELQIVSNLQNPRGVVVLGSNDTAVARRETGSVAAVETIAKRNDRACPVRCRWANRRRVFTKPLVKHMAWPAIQLGLQGGLVTDSPRWLVYAMGALRPALCGDAQFPPPNHAG
jgi:hypothetical protein